jgi:phage terminase large subunit GpA-like protein
MAIYVWIVDKGGTLAHSTIESQPEFDLMKDRGIYYHLSHLWEQVSKKTGMKIIDDEDAFYEESNLALFYEAVKSEITESESIPVDEWTFCSDKQIIKTIQDKEYTPDQYDTVKAYVAEWFCKSYKYEIIRATQSELTLEIRKQYYTVNKLELMRFLTTLKLKIELTIERGQRFYLSYG